MLLNIDPEFQALIPPLASEELQGLEADIVRDGRAIVPLVVWDSTLLDGHHRYEICTGHGLPYTTQKAPACVVDRETALLWIIDNQNHRRNLPDIDRVALLTRKAALLSARAAANQEASRAKPGEKIGEHEAAKASANLRSPLVVNRALAKEVGVGERTIDHHRKVLSAGVPELVQAVRENSIAVSTAARLADLPPERQREVARDKDSARAAAKALREETANERRETRCAAIAAMAAPQPQLDLQQRYPVVYADPPWRYEHIETESRAIENQYPTMSLDEIKALPVTAIATDDAVLFLWATSPKLAEALEVMSAWGWTYRTCMVWDKEIIGMGYYARQQHELLLIGTRGSPPPPEPSSRPPSVFRERRGEHSAKPDHYYDLIESMYPDWPRVELFARRPRTGWQQWGNQVGS